MISLRVAGAAKAGRGAFLTLVGCGLALTTLTGAMTQPVRKAGQTTSILRLTEDQYRHTVADLFGEDIKITGRLEPDRRREGLLSNGASVVTVTPSGFEQYDAIARSVAAQVLDEKHRASFVPCAVKDPSKADGPCAKTFVSRTGRMVFRRPLSDAETRYYTKLADRAANEAESFHRGLEVSLAAMLVSPNFLFRIETARPDPEQPAVLELDAYTKAARLSYLLWNSTPDDELLRAASAGDLETATGLSGQVDRLMSSPRFERGVRAFFSDMLGFDGFATLAKDPEIYPAYNAKVARDAREQTLMLIVDHLIRRNEDYRDLFTTRRTFLTRTLGIIYGTPVVSRTGWDDYEFPAGDPRGGGLLGQISFLVLHSHPGRSSATLRGKAIRNLLLCQEVPAPPPDVDFALVEDPSNPELKTARQRLDVHATDPTCASCHKLMDPLGLPLESFDSSGAMRETENGAKIDASGEHNGKSFSGILGLGRALHDDPQTPACVVERMYAYGTGRPLTLEDKVALADLSVAFAADSYRFRTLVRSLATSKVFFRATAPGDTDSRRASVVAPQKG